MKRICIFLTYDKQKTVDKYIAYMLKELKTCVDCLIVVCNEVEILCGKEYLEAYADDIFYRENIGFDAGGYKDALCNLVGWEKVLSFDELILVNDSMFGPFRAMKDIFLEMESKNVDFWGLSKHGEFQKNGFDHFSEHIQSFFFAFRYNILHSLDFRKYWENMPYYSSYNQAVREYEMKFTSWFAGKGYSYDVLADTERNDSDNPENNYTQFAKIAYELIRKRNFPFLKKQQLADESLEKQTQENLRLAMDYIDKETPYDVNLIWDNVIRTLNMTDLQRSLHLHYIIKPNEPKQREDTVIIIFASYESAAEYVLEYLQILKHHYKVILFTHNRKLHTAYRKQDFECRMLNAGAEQVAFMNFSAYKYVCILHDTDMSSEERASCIGKSYFYNIWENLLKNEKHISGIIERFEDEPRLGFLTHPQPNFAEYFGELGKGWNGKFEQIQQIGQKMNLQCQLSEELPPFRVTDDFWIRGCILKRLSEMAETDFEYLPYLWSYFAQDAGYYSGITESPDYASMNEVNLQFYLKEIAEQVRRQYGDFRDFVEFKKMISCAAMKEFCRTYPRIFVYGTGFMARRYRDLIEHVEAYVVSDGQTKPEELEGRPVKYLSEIPISDDCGFILCLNKKHQAQVIKNLEAYKIKNYMCI